MKKLIPLFSDLSSYSKGSFQQDLVSGLTVGVMLVPQGMAYAYLAGMPPIYGLYAGLVPLIMYAVFGSSRHLSVGPVAVSALLVFAGLSQIAEPMSARFVELAIFTGLLIGIFQILMSLLRLGLLVNFISYPVISGFTSAAAVIVAISQMKDVLGITMPRFNNQIETVNYLLSHFFEMNWLAVFLSLGSLTALISFRKINKRIPGALIIVVLSTILSWHFDFLSMGVEVVGQVPSGLPRFVLPSISMEDFYLLIPTVLTVSAISIVESLGIAKIYEGKSKTYKVQNNQELFALGIANLAGSFFKSMPTSGSFSRTAVNYSAHSKTGLASIVTALVVLLSLLFLTPLFKHLPMSVLAAIILLAVFNLFDYKEAIRLWKVHRRDFVMLISTFLGTLLFGIEIGVLLGFSMSIITVLYRSSKPNVAILGKVKGTEFYRSLKRYPDLEITDSLRIIRFDDQLYYANANYFRDKISQILHGDSKIRTMILDASNVHDIDSTGLTVIEDLRKEAEEAGVDLRLCNLVEQVEDVLVQAGLINAELNSIKCYNSIQDAVKNI